VRRIVRTLVHGPCIWRATVGRPSPGHDRVMPRRALGSATDARPRRARAQCHPVPAHHPRSLSWLHSHVGATGSCPGHKKLGLEVLPFHFRERAEKHGIELIDRKELSGWPKQLLGLFSLALEFVGPHGSSKFSSDAHECARGIARNPGVVLAFQIAHL